MFLQYLRPKLRTFRSVGGPNSDYFLMQIQARCPALRSLWLHNQLSTITANDLLRFLNDMPSLTSIRLGGDPEDVINNAVHLHLASRPNLAALKTSDKMLRLSLVKRMQEVVDQPFPELVYLLCFSESKAFCQLSRHLTRLTELHLHLVDAASKTIFDICSCTSRLRLELDFEHNSQFDANSHFSSEGLLALAKSCSHLQSLTVTHSQWLEKAGAGIADITDEVIQGFVALLPELSCFRIKIKTSLTHRALIILGEGCTSLKHCSLEGKSFDLRLLESNGPVLFPRLECPELKPPQEGLSAAMAAEILHHHAPRAKKLKIGKSPPFGVKVFVMKPGLSINSYDGHETF